MTHRGLNMCPAGARCAYCYPETVNTTPVIEKGAYEALDAVMGMMYEEFPSERGEELLTDAVRRVAELVEREPERGAKLLARWVREQEAGIREREV